MVRYYCNRSLLACLRQNSAAKSTTIKKFSQEDSRFTLRFNLILLVEETS